MATPCATGRTSRVACDLRRARELHVRFARNGNKIFERYLTPIEETVWTKDRDGKSSVQGRVGITYAPFVPLVGVIDVQSPAARAGLRTHDLVISIDGQPVRNWSDVQRHLGKLARRTNLVYFRGSELPGIPAVELLAPGFADLVPDSELDPAAQALELHRYRACRDVRRACRSGLSGR